MKTLLYAVLHAAEAEVCAPLVGVDGAAIAWTRAAGLAVACSPLSAELRAPNVPQLLAYANAIETLHRWATVVPLRFGCILKDETQAADLLQTRQEDFFAWLEGVAGCTEMGLRLLSQDAVAKPAFAPSRPAEHANAGPPSGRAYLAERRAWFASCDAWRRRVDEKAEEVRKAFAPVAVQFAAEPSPARPGLPMGFHFLVRRGDKGRFESLFRLFQAGSPDDVLLTGPWPPYHFVGGPRKENPHG